MVKKGYATRVKVDQTLLWIELKRTCYEEARKTAEDFLGSGEIVEIPEKAKQVKPRTR